MVTIPLSHPAGMLGVFSPWTREDVRAMLDRPAVIITAILSALVLMLSFVGALTFLAYSGKGTEVLVFAVIGPVVGILVALLRRMAKLEEKANQIQVNTNGTTTRLLDAALPTPPER